MRSLALLLALMAVIAASGCVSSSVMDMEITQIARTSEVVDQFLAEHPNAEINIQLIKEDSLSADSDFSSKCTSIAASDLYKVDITDSESGTEAWAFVDANGTVVCAYAEGSQSGDQQQPSTPQTGNGNGGQSENSDIDRMEGYCINGQSICYYPIDDSFAAKSLHCQNGKWVEQNCTPSLVCREGECIPACKSHAYVNMICTDECILYWMDACGNREEKVGNADNSMSYCNNLGNEIANKTNIWGGYIEGIDIYKKGTTARKIVMQGTVIDTYELTEFCIDSNTLREYGCITVNSTNKSHLHEVNINCNCYDGACVSDDYTVV